MKGKVNNKTVVLGCPVLSLQSVVVGYWPILMKECVYEFPSLPPCLGQVHPLPPPQASTKAYVFPLSFEMLQEQSCFVFILIVEDNMLVIRDYTF